MAVPVASVRGAALAVLVCLATGTAAAVGEALVGWAGLVVLVTALTVGEFGEGAAIVAAVTVAYGLGVGGVVEGVAVVANLERQPSRSK